jgi:hypothetical protein
MLRRQAPQPPKGGVPFLSQSDSPFRGLGGFYPLSITSGTIVTWDDEAILEDNIMVVAIWKWLLTDVTHSRSHAPAPSFTRSNYPV